MSDGDSWNKLLRYKGVWDVEGMRVVVDEFEKGELSARREADDEEIAIGYVLTNPRSRKVAELPAERVSSGD